METNPEKGNFKFRLKIDIVSHPASGQELGIYIY